tara:strand:- start:56 stop:757 length:702 start_codon:yes stop_codon:yes gene_type:complete
MLGIATGITNTSYQWQPNHVGADLKLWLRNGVGVAAAQWDDSSGNSNHVVQGTGGNQATVSGGGLEFDASDDYYDITADIRVASEEACMIFIVMELDNVGNDTILGIDATAEFVEFQTNKVIRIKIDGTTVQAAFSAATFTNNNKMVVGIQREEGGTGNLNIYKNGALLTPTSQVANSGAIDFKTIGSRGGGSPDRFFDGHIFELLVYDTTELTTGEIGKINNYLINKHTPLG